MTYFKINGLNLYCKCLFKNDCINYKFHQVFELSGILTVFFCGVVMSHYAWHNVTHNSQVTTKCVIISKLPLKIKSLCKIASFGAYCLNESIHPSLCGLHFLQAYFCNNVIYCWSVYLLVRRYGLTGCWKMEVCRWQVTIPDNFIPGTVNFAWD